MANRQQDPVEITVNGQPHQVQATPDTPVLYVLRNELGLNAAKFGCGLAQCGACTVLRDGQPIRSCVMPISDVVGTQLTTLEGLEQRVLFTRSNKPFSTNRPSSVGIAFRA